MSREGQSVVDGIQEENLGRQQDPALSHVRLKAELEKERHIVVLPKRLSITHPHLEFVMQSLIHHGDVELVKLRLGQLLRIVKDYHTVVEDNYVEICLDSERHNF